MGNCLNCFVKIEKGINRFERKLPVVLARAALDASVLAAVGTSVAPGMVLNEFLYARLA